MKKRIIVTEKQLREYIERKKTKKTFCSIVERLHKNSKLLCEGISLERANETVIDLYRRNGKITPEVENMLKEYGIIKEKGGLNG